MVLSKYDNGLDNTFKMTNFIGFWKEKTQQKQQKFVLKFFLNNQIVTVFTKYLDKQVLFFFKK